MKTIHSVSVIQFVCAPVRGMAGLRNDNHKCLMASSSITALDQADNILIVLIISVPRSPVLTQKQHGQSHLVATSAVDSRSQYTPSQCTA